MAYLHYNPVKHSLVGKLSEWPYSSFHRYVRQDSYAEDWDNNSIGFSESFLGKLE